MSIKTNFLTYNELNIWKLLDEIVCITLINKCVFIRTMSVVLEKLTNLLSDKIM